MTRRITEPGILHAPGMVKFLSQKNGQPGCWVWIRYRKKDGYGLTKLNGRTTVASRVAWQLTYGPIPPGLYVLHRCDNPACCRPDHLFLGTAKDNYEDAKAKDRHTRGERIWCARLSNNDIREIRALAGRVTQTSLARKFNIRQSSIWLIQNRRQWTHVAD